MNTGLISLRYARALYDYAKQENVEKTVYSLSKDLIRVFSENVNMNLILAHPLMSKSEKRTLLVSVVEKYDCPVFVKFIDIVLNNNRENRLQLFLLKFVDYYQELNHIYSGKLVTSIKIDDDTEKKLFEFFDLQDHTTLEIKKIVDPEILGGFLLEVHQLRWDATVATQLKKIKSEFNDYNSRSLS